MKDLVNLYSHRIQALKNTLLDNNHPKIKYNIPDSGYFGCIHVDGSVEYDKVIADLNHKNIKIFDTSECFLKEYKCNNYFRLTISEVNEKQIEKNVPIILKSIANHLK